MSFIAFLVGIVLGFVGGSMYWAKNPDKIVKFNEWVKGIFKKKA